MVIAQHCWALGHQTQFEKNPVLFRYDSWHSCVTRESLKVALTEHCLNQEEGLELSTVWLPLYERLGKRRLGA